MNFALLTQIPLCFQSGLQNFGFHLLVLPTVITISVCIQTEAFRQVDIHLTSLSLREHVMLFVCNKPV